MLAHRLKGVWRGAEHFGLLHEQGQRVFPSKFAWFDILRFIISTGCLFQSKEERLNHKP